MGKFKEIAAELGLIYAAAIWGATFYMVKGAITAVNPIALVGYRFLTASFILGAILFILKKDIFSKFKNGFVLGLLLWGLYIPQTLGLKYTTAANSGFITGTFIIYVPILMYIMYKKKPEFNRVLSIIIVILGLWFLTGGLIELNFGDILTMISAVGYAAHLMVSDKFMKQGLNPYIVTFQQFLVTGILSILTLILIDGSFSVSSTPAVWSIIFLAIFPSLTAFIIQLWAQKSVAPLKVSIIFSLEPVFGAIFSWTLGNEKFFLLNAIGGIIIVGGMILSELPDLKGLFKIKNRRR